MTPARRARWPLVAVAAVGGVGELVRRRRSARTQPSPSRADPGPEEAPASAPAPPPLTTQSSPGQIADLQQAYGADMGPTSAPPDTATPSV